MVRESVNLLELLRKQAAGGDLDFLREAVAVLAEAVMEAEVAAQVGAGYGERSETRLTRRNGYRPRRWDTRAGSIELQIPKLRQGSYFPALLEPRRRAERALLAVVQQAYVEGVSTRRVDDLVRSLGCEGISKSQVSRICSELDTVVTSFLERPLDGGPYRYLWLDALTQRVREEGRIAQVSPAGYPRVRRVGRLGDIGAARQPVRDRHPVLFRYRLDQRAYVRLLADRDRETPEPTPVATPEPTPEPTPVATPEPTPVATPTPAPVATPEPTPCADLEDGCTPWDSFRIAREGNAAGYSEFWNGGPRTVCSFATTGFGALGDEHHAAARAATQAWNEAVGGEPALFAYQPDCPEGFAAAWPEHTRTCDWAYANARQDTEYIPIIWVTAEAAVGAHGTYVACAVVGGAHNGAPAFTPGWQAAVIVGSGADVDGGYDHTIAHELGHVLYLDHTCNERSIMLGRCSTPYVPSGIIPADYLQIRAALGRN